MFSVYNDATSCTQTMTSFLWARSYIASMSRSFLFDTEESFCWGRGMSRSFLLDTKAIFCWGQGQRPSQWQLSERVLLSKNPRTIPTQPQSQCSSIHDRGLGKVANMGHGDRIPRRAIKRVSNEGKWVGFFEIEHIKKKIHFNLFSRFLVGRILGILKDKRYGETFFLNKPRLLTWVVEGLRWENPDILWLVFVRVGVRRGEATSLKVLLIKKE